MEKIIHVHVHLYMGVLHETRFVRDTCATRPEIPLS